MPDKGCGNRGSNGLKFFTDNGFESYKSQVLSLIIKSYKSIIQVSIRLFRTGAGDNFRGLPDATILPSLIITILSQNALHPYNGLSQISSFPPRASCLMKFQKCCLVTGSNPEVGSSRKRISGLCKSEQPSASLWRQPVGNSLVFRFADIPAGRVISKNPINALGPLRLRRHL